MQCSPVFFSASQDVAAALPVDDALASCAPCAVLAAVLLFS